MPIRIDLDNSKNIEFLKFIIEKIKEKDDHSPSFSVEIPVQKGVTPFPVFDKTETSSDPTTAAAEARLDANKEYDQEADHIGRYLKSTFKDDITMMLPLRAIDNSAVLNVLLVINNPHGIYVVAEELKHRKPIAKAKIEATSPPGFSATPTIYYNIKNGKGFTDNRDFTFKSKSKEFKVFAEMYKKINDPVPREKVLALAGYEKREDGYYDPFSALKSSEKRDTTDTTYFINELAKKIRGTTKLDTYHLSNNDGNLTLTAKKQKTLPQRSLTSPK